MTLPALAAAVMTAAAIISWGLLLWLAASGIYCWGRDNGHWGHGPGVE